METLVVPDDFDDDAFVEWCAANEFDPNLDESYKAFVEETNWQEPVA